MWHCHSGQPLLVLNGVKLNVLGALLGYGHFMGGFFWRLILAIAYLLEALAKDRLDYAFLWVYGLRGIYMSLWLTLLYLDEHSSRGRQNKLDEVIPIQMLDASRLRHLSCTLYCLLDM